MSVLRDISHLLARKTTETYRAALRQFLDIKTLWQYQPVGQDAGIPLGDPDEYVHKGVQRSRLRKVLLCCVILLLLWGAVSVVPLHKGALFGSTTALTRETITKDQFITALLNNPVEGILDPDPVRRKCDETKFQDGLVWHCSLINGGVGNVGNMLINCVRYAIEAGDPGRGGAGLTIHLRVATTLILPRVGHRSAENLVDLGGEAGSVDISYLYDASYFLEAWQVACPQMRAVMSESDVPNLPADDSPTRLVPNRFGELERTHELIVNATPWRGLFDTWLAGVDGFQNMSSARPVRIIQHPALSHWNRAAEPQDFARSFARLFRFPLQIRQLAASALWNLESRLGHPVVSDAILFPPADLAGLGVNSLSEHRTVPGGYMGAHLRVASDAVKAGWPGYENQAPFYISEAERLNLTTIYLATGSPEHRERFRQDATERGLSIVVKEDLFEAEQLVELQNLTWDQQALVDFQILVNSAYFTGFSKSSFSWIVAIRRSILPEAGQGVVTRKARNVVKYRDGLSALVVRFDGMTPGGIWP